VNGSIDRLHTPLGTTNIYISIAKIHTSQITTASAKHFPACFFSNSRSLSTASNSGDSSISLAQVFLSQPAMQNSLLTDNSAIAPSLLSLSCKAQLNCQASTNWIVPVFFFITTLHGPKRKQISAIITLL
jgi:hypothetical protein